MNNNIIETLTRIEAKLDAVIAALHEYDNDGYGESSFEAFMDDEEAANKRMDIIGQNGNEGSHYVTNEEADEDARMDIQDERVVGDNGRESGLKAMNEGQPKQKQYYKNKRSKRSENKK
jgi:hypothetical protein